MNSIDEFSNKVVMITGANRGIGKAFADYFYKHGAYIALGVRKTNTLKNIFFTINKSELLSESFIELDKLVRYLNERPKISGHTDNTGNEDQNKTLSESRAKAVADYLILKGIDKSRINYIGYGSSKPVATNDTNEGKQQNRRVEFIISRN
jgi:OmpA-OmpF porin, OOP family